MHTRSNFALIAYSHATVLQALPQTPLALPARLEAQRTARQARPCACEHNSCTSTSFMHDCCELYLNYMLCSDQRGACCPLHGAWSCRAASPIQRTHVIVHMSVILRILIPHFLTMDHMYTSALREALYKLSVRSYVRWDGGA